MKSSLKKIVILGPESTGKSVLTKQLSDHYGGSLVPEYARQFLDEINRPYEENDLVEIAKGQIRSEEKEQSTGSMLFCDTNLIVIKIWSDFKYGKTDPWILQSLVSRKYDFYLLTDIDLPWEPDPLREHPNQRQELFALYQTHLSGNELPFTVISGTGDERLDNAISAINSNVK